MSVNRHFIKYIHIIIKKLYQLKPHSLYQSQNHQGNVQRQHFIFVITSTAREGSIHIQITFKSTTIIIPNALCCSSGTYIIIPKRPSNHSPCKSIVVFEISGHRVGQIIVARVIRNRFISLYYVFTVLYHSRCDYSSIFYGFVSFYSCRE